MKSIQRDLPIVLQSLTLLLLLLPSPSLASPSKTLLIPSTSFNTTTSFSNYWSLNYPWGTDHNGAARMSPSQVVTSSDGTTLTLTAHRVTGQKPATHGGKQIPIKYLSGAIHAKQHFTITSPSSSSPGSSVSGYDFSAEFRAPVAKGTWPAFWLTAVNGWPPEIDMAEWKGSGKISFNTFNTSSQVMARDVAYGNDKEWHRVLCEVRRDDRRKGSGKDVEVRFWMDGKLVVTQWGRGYVGKALYL